MTSVTWAMPAATSTDVLRRYPIWRGLEVTFVQNFTDIDDKISKELLKKTAR